MSKKWFPMGNPAFSIDEISTDVQKSAQDTLAEQILAMSNDLARRIESFTDNYDGNDRDSIRSLGKVKDANRKLGDAQRKLSSWINAGWPGSW